MSVDRFCATCGRPRRADDRFCASCGRSFAPSQSVIAPPPSVEVQPPNGVLPSNVSVAVPEASLPFWAKPAQADAIRDYQSPWLTFALTATTFGLYAFYWVFDTWRQIKRHDGDEGKSPIGHTLAMIVPLYNLFRMHAHMRTIIELVQSFRGQTSLSAGWCVVLWIAVGAVYRGSNTPGAEGLFLIGALIEAAMLAWAQNALNLAWSLKLPQARSRTVHPVYWVVLAFGAIITALAIIGVAK